MLAFDSIYLLPKKYRSMSNINVIKLKFRRLIVKNHQRSFLADYVSMRTKWNTLSSPLFIFRYGNITF